ncbi:MAG: HIT family protein [Acidimicrobiales bacterium]
MSASSEPTLFTRIIRGELPGRFVWRDDEVVAFLTIAPHQPGHTLVVPVAQIDRWTDLPDALWVRLNVVALEIGRALDEAFDCERVGTVIAGLEVPHCHVHLIPIQREADLGFGGADHNARPEDLDAAAERIREVLRARGHSNVV